MSRSALVYNDRLCSDQVFRLPRLYPVDLRFFVRNRFARQSRLVLDYSSSRCRRLRFLSACCLRKTHFVTTNRWRFYYKFLLNGWLKKHVIHGNKGRTDDFCIGSSGTLLVLINLTLDTCDGVVGGQSLMLDFFLSLVGFRRVAQYIEKVHVGKRLEHWFTLLDNFDLCWLARHSINPSRRCGHRTRHDT